MYMYNEHMTTLSELSIDPAKLRAARGERRACDVAKQIGVLRSSLANYEAGRSIPPGDVLARLCCLYQIHPDQLATR